MSMRRLCVILWLEFPTVYSSMQKDKKVNVKFMSCKEKLCTESIFSALSIWMQSFYQEAAYFSQYTSCVFKIRHRVEGLIIDFHVNRNFKQVAWIHENVFLFPASTLLPGFSCACKCTVSHCHHVTAVVLAFPFSSSSSTSDTHCLFTLANTLRPCCSSSPSMSLNRRWTYSEWCK